MKVDVSFVEAAMGCEREIQYDRSVVCEDCQGNGAKPGTSPISCPQCRGRGQVVHSQGFFSVSSPCPRCRGQGVEIKERCERCHGRGRHQERKKLNVKIPPGVDNGNRVRLVSEGEGGEYGGPAGDLFVEIGVHPDKRFRRENKDIVCDVDITLAQSCLGTHIEIETIKGREFIEIPRGTQPGDRIRLPGLGFPSIKGYGRGDQFLEVKVKIPKRLTPRQEELIREFAVLSDDVVSGPVAGFFERFKRKSPEDPSKH